MTSFQLVGLWDSPYVRRVAVTMRLKALEFTPIKLSVIRHSEQLRAYSPLLRVPALVVPEGETLIESAAILDYLEGVGGNGWNMLPPHGASRRRSQYLIGLALTAADKAVAMTIIPRVESDTGHIPQRWLGRCATQVNQALDQLEASLPEQGWAVEQQLGLADITIACAYGFIEAYQAQLSSPKRPRLHALCQQAEALPAFVATPMDL